MMRRLLILLPLLIPFALHGATPKLPLERELKSLVSDTLLAFNKGVQQKNFTQFYQERLSAPLRDQMSPEKFAGNFQVFIDKNYDISTIAKADPVFDAKPAIDGDGILVLQGHYSTKPNKVTFTLKYIDESSTWKLIGIDVRAVPFGESTAEIPTGRDLKKLVLDSLLSFNQAVKTGNFDKFYDQIAKAWQKEVTPDQLLKIFKPFVNKNVDIGPIANLEPAFDEPPAMNDDGQLAIYGSYPTKPSKVSFELKYLSEEEAWKLVGINVKVKSDSDKVEKEPAKDDEEDEDDNDNDRDND
jgi:hypothetical protein